MNLSRFLADRRESWLDLDSLVQEARSKPERLGGSRVLRLGRLYRAGAADLALARRSFPNDPVVAHLEQLVGRARSLVYDAPTRRGSLRRFVGRDYWRLVLSRPVPLLASVAILTGSTLLSGTWAVRDPGAAAGLVPGVYQAVTEPRPHGSDIGLSSSDETGIATQIFTNNIQVTFEAFAAGLLLAIGAVVLLVYNGVLLGTVAGLAISSGNGRVFFELVSAHGMLELSCIAVSAAAGMRIGWAVVDPGRRSRADALVHEARRSVAIVIGTAPWLVVAGLVEGFLTPSGLSLGEAIAIGAALAALFWSLLLWRGRATRARATSPADTP